MMMSNIETKNKKKELRREIRELKAVFEKKELDLLSNKIMSRLEKNKSFIEADNILLYYSLSDEVNTIAFIKKWSKHKNIVLPVVVGDDLILKKYVESEMKEGYKSIMEPFGTDIFSPKDLQLCIIPGMAFDISCSRLGRGKGFYDRLLEILKCKKIGVCFDFQVVQSLPCEEFDKKMDNVLTETHFFSSVSF